MDEEESEVKGTERPQGKQKRQNERTGKLWLNEEVMVKQRKSRLLLEGLGVNGVSSIFFFLNQWKDLIFSNTDCSVFYFIYQCAMAAVWQDLTKSLCALIGGQMCGNKRLLSHIPEPRLFLCPEHCWCDIQGAGLVKLADHGKSWPRGSEHPLVTPMTSGI